MGCRSGAQTVGGLLGVDPDVPSGSWAEDHAVDHQTVVIRLELHVADDTLTGRASDATGATKEFSGWLGLTSAVDALLQGTPAPIKAVDDGEAL